MQNIINQCINNGEYFLRLEELYVYFEESNIPYTDRINILKQIKENNKKVYNKEKEISKEYLEIKNRAENLKDDACLNDFKSEEKNKNTIEPLKCDYKEYFKKISETKNIDEIISFLPERDNVEFDNILSVILVKLYSQKVEILNFMKQYKEDVYEIFESDLNLVEEKIETILDYKEQKDIIKETSTQNKIVFLKNLNNEPIIFQNLKGCEEYYDSFLELFNSIIDGTLKNFGTYNNNNKINNLFKVKLFKTRIIFSRINEDTFAVLGATIKKCDNDSRHRNFLHHLSLAYENQEQNLINIANNEELLKIEDEYKEKLIYLLENKKKVKTYEIN